MIFHMFDSIERRDGCCRSDVDSFSIHNYSITIPERTVTFALRSTLVWCLVMIQFYYGLMNRCMDGWMDQWMTKSDPPLSVFGLLSCSFFLPLVDSKMLGKPIILFLAPLCLAVR